MLKFTHSKEVPVFPSFFTSIFSSSYQLILHGRHSHEKFLFFTVQLLLDLKMHSWWLVTWLDLNGRLGELSGSYALLVRAVWNTAIYIRVKLALWQRHCSLYTFVVKDPQLRAVTAPSALSKDHRFPRLALCWLITAAGRRFANGDGYRAIDPAHVSTASIFSFFPRSDFLCEYGAALVFERFDSLVLLWVCSADLGHHFLKSLRPTNFNKRRG
jgi:hypothetical protein